MVTAKLASGRFEATISIPLFASEERKRAFIEAWLSLIEQGIKVGRSSQDREYKNDAPAS